MRKFKLIFLTLIALSLLLAACSSATPAVTPPASEAAASPGAAYPAPYLQPAVVIYPEPLAVPAYPEPAQTVEASMDETRPTPETVVCQPTPQDQLGPFYVPGAPERDKVGEGYVLSGVVRGYPSCAPLTEAQVEFWMAGPDGEYADEFRATLYVDEQGAFRFESHVPVPYEGRPPHIHIRVMADGYETLITQHYPESGAASGMMDLVLIEK